MSHYIIQDTRGVVMRFSASKAATETNPMFAAVFLERNAAKNAMFRYINPLGSWSVSPWVFGVPPSYAIYNTQADRWVSGFDVNGGVTHTGDFKEAVPFTTKEHAAKYAARVLNDWTGDVNPDGVFGEFTVVTSPNYVRTIPDAEAEIKRDVPTVGRPVNPDEV